MPSYTLKKKLDSIDYHRKNRINGISGNAKALNISPSTLALWIKQEKNIRELPRKAVRRRLPGGGRRLKTAASEQIVVEWISERTKEGLPPSNNAIKRYAAEKVPEIAGISAEALDKWTRRFLKRHGIQLKTVIRQRERMMQCPCCKYVYKVGIDGRKVAFFQHVDRHIKKNPGLDLTEFLEKYEREVCRGCNTSYRIARFHLHTCPAAPRITPAANDPQAQVMAALGQTAGGRRGNRVTAQQAAAAAAAAANVGNYLTAQGQI